MLWYQPFTQQMQDEAEALGDGEVFNLGRKFGEMKCQVSGSFSGTVTFEASVDGVNYSEIKGIRLDSGADVSSTAWPATAPCVVSFSVHGIDKLRARVSVYASGKISVYGVVTI